LLVAAVHYQGLKRLFTELLNRDEGLERELNRKIKLTQDLRDQARGGLVRTEKEGAVAHIAMVGTLVCTGKLLT
jgi:hypothetical protein